MSFNISVYVSGRDYVYLKYRFRSIGLRKYGINSLRDLCVSTIPPAVFIAVMAIQLRYFNPLLSSSALVPTLLPSSLSPDSPSCAKRMDTTQIVEEGTESGGLFYFLFNMCNIIFMV